MSEVPPSSEPNNPTPAPAVEVTPGVPDAADVEQNKVFAALAYLGLLFLVPLLAAPKSPFAKFHANQGLVLFLTEMGLGIVLVILMVVFGVLANVIPVVGQIISAITTCVMCFVIPLFMAACLVPAIMGLISALNGQMKPLPVIGKYKILK